MATDPPTLGCRNARVQICQPLSPWLALFYSPWLAFFLCAPGAACFVMYFCNNGNFGALGGMLLAAVMTALTSLVIYGRYARLPQRRGRDCSGVRNSVWLK